MSAATEPGWVRKLWPFLKRHKRHVLVAFGVAIAGQVITSLLPLVQRAIIDDTITTAGMLPASTFQALWALDEAGVRTVLVTGRPAAVRRMDRC